MWDCEFGVGIKRGVLNRTYGVNEIFRLSLISGSDMKSPLTHAEGLR